ncbi:MAG: RHS repeat-associated core domain-containing protein, partial [Myxococcota bacterium]|nr:RHS repeat-associated core domain-containing protein [Myxococcota bacterium]
VIEEEFTSDRSGDSLSGIHVYTFRWWADCGYSLSYCVTSETIAQMSDDIETSPFAHASESYKIGPLFLEESFFDFPGARLQSWDRDDLADILPLDRADYGFDALGNWIGVWEREEERARFSYNAERNRLIAADLDEQHVYTWDEAGFMQSRDHESLVWDTTGRPSSLGSGHEIRWDSLGRPISYRMGDDVSFPLFGGRVMGDAERTPLRIDLLWVEIDLATDDRLYRQLDHRGNVHFAMNEAGEVSNLYSYSPFGVAEEWGPGDNGRTFAQGQEMGRYIWLKNRLYDPEVGRFLSPDPLYQLVNQFSYTLGNPVFFWDPDGRHSSPSPLVSLAKKIMKFADRLQNLGYAAFKTALDTGAYSSALSALVSVVAGIALKWSMEQMCSECVPNVEIEDPPFETEAYDEDAGAEGSNSGADVSTCSPQILEAGRSRMHQGWIWFPLQFLLAVFLLRLGRRKSLR